MINNNKNLDKLQQENQNKMDYLPLRVQDFIDIGVEDLENEWEKEILIEAILKRIANRGVSSFKGGGVLMVLPIIRKLRDSMKMYKHRQNVLRFVSENLGSSSYRSGLLFGLSGAMVKG